MFSIKIKPLYLLLLISLASCSTNNNEEAHVEEEKEISTDQQSEVRDDTPDSWAIYTGNVGLYGKHIILELAVYGDSVRGTYFYSKHQKPLILSGTIDSKNHIKAVETYNNKPTGYWEFNFSKGDIVGSWSKSPSMNDPEGIIAKLCDIDKGDFNPVHQTYENKHLITFYNAEGEDETEVVDICKINKLNSDYFTFHYNVIRRNGHLGSIEGLGKFQKDGKGIYKDDENCELTFVFNANTVEIMESDCGYYHGAYAYFDGTLTKVK